MAYATPHRISCERKKERNLSAVLFLSVFLYVILVKTHLPHSLCKKRKTVSKSLSIAKNTKKTVKTFEYGNYISILDAMRSLCDVTYGFDLKFSVSSPAAGL